jgi:hypothetical protein
VEEEGEEGNCEAVTNVDTVHVALEMLSHFRHIALAGMEFGTVLCERKGFKLNSYE